MFFPRSYRKWVLRWLVISVCVCVVGCGGSVTIPPPGDTPDGQDQALETGDDDAPGTQDQSQDGVTDDPPGTQDEGDQSDNGEETSDNNEQDQQVPEDVVLTGRIRSPAAQKSWGPAKWAVETYMVVAQSNETGKIYRGSTDEAGQFEIDIPEAEAGNTFMTTVIGPEGQALGPVLFDTTEDTGATGLALDGEVSLGTIDLPPDPTSEPILPGDDADFDGDMVDDEVQARLDENGVPVGLPTHGKGLEAENDSPAPDQMIDADQDGLIDMVDADDNGNGIVDDFDGNGEVGGTPPGISVNFFMNLKIGAERAEVYYTGTEEEIASGLSTDTVITFEVMTEPGSPRKITGARMLDVPAPPYLSDSLKTSDGFGGIQLTPWVESNYALDAYSDRFGAFVVPGAVMNSGDTFTLEVTYEDGTTEQYSRMINYVFKNIPKLVRYGHAEAMQDFHLVQVGDPDGPELPESENPPGPPINGTVENPILFDGTKDLVLVFNPPLDETGAYLTKLDYSFQIFYHAEADGRQLNEEIDEEATWPEPLTGLYVRNEDLSFAADDNTHTVVLPKEAFPDTVILTTGEQAAVDYYKIDITAECPSGNAAIMLAFRKQ